MLQDHKYAHSLFEFIDNSFKASVLFEKKHITIAKINIQLRTFLK